jgi:hypothetical protein
LHTLAWDGRLPSDRTPGRPPRWSTMSMTVNIMLRTLITIAVVLTACCAAFGDESPCSDAKRALTEGDRLRSWDALHKSYRLYGKCDDGALAEGYSESVARILVDHWSTLPRLAFLARNDDKFLRFVLRHVDATLDVNDLRTIEAKGQRQCPVGLGTVCDELEERADSALKEATSPQ